MLVLVLVMGVWVDVVMLLSITVLLADVVMLLLADHVTMLVVVFSEFTGTK